MESSKGKPFHAHSSAIGAPLRLLMAARQILVICHVTFDSAFE
jgi:hypothetical protein